MAEEASLADYRLRVTQAAQRVAAEVHRIRTLADEFRDVALAAPVVVSTDIGTNIQAVKYNLQVAEASLREVEVWIDRVANEVIAETGVAAFLPQALRDMTNLLLLDRYPHHKKALEEWRRAETDLSARVSRRETRSADVTNQIFNIIGWYAVFLGVVLTAVSQLTQTVKEDSPPLCGKIWFPIVLTVFGSVVTIWGIIYKFKTLKSLEETIQSEKQTKQELEGRVNTLRSKGPQRFSFTEDVHDNKTRKPPKNFWKDKSLVFLALIIFAGIFILSYFVIMCDTWTIQALDNGLPG